MEEVVFFFNDILITTENEGMHLKRLETLFVKLLELDLKIG